MHYDKIKEPVGRFFNRSPWLRKLFYRLLDLLLLRTWHVHRELKKWRSQASPEAHILDAGSGFGQYTYFLTRLGKNYS
ncbi:MAG: methyltransferase type 11, partial [Flavobacteriales bacterium]|nr:methyltransferase type 11 [Flavobacteriales bacterium]